jgi:hypothetical protein
MTSLPVWVKKDAGRGEAAMLRRLSDPALTRRSRTVDLRLVIPEAIAIDEAAATLVLPVYDGEPGIWDEADGGANANYTPLSIVHLLLDLRATFRSVEWEQQSVPVFDHEVHASLARRTVDKLREHRLLSAGDREAVLELLDRHCTCGGNTTVHNGDFYPRNLIFQPNGKVALIDWETNDGIDDLAIIAPMAHIATYFWAHMWGNPQWQRQFKSRGYMETLLWIGETEFVWHATINALRLARLWLEQGHAPAERPIAEQVATVRALLGREVVPA